MKMSWDDEINLLQEDISQLQKQVQRLPDVISLNAIAEIRSELNQALGDFGTVYERIMGLMKSSTLKSNQARITTTVMQWSRNFLIKLKVYSDELIALQNRKMWLRIIQARFSDVSGESASTMGAQQLVDLVQRRQQLEKIEKTLQTELSGVMTHREILTTKYQSLEAADQNWIAAQTMSSRLGVNIRDVAQNPTTKGLKEFFLAALVPLRHPSEEKRLELVSVDLSEQSQKMVEQCLRISSNFVRQGRDAIDKKSINNFKNIMTRVEDLNHELTHSLGLLREQPLPVCRPKLVHKSSKIDHNSAL
jgi:hypothetical protein